MEREARRDVIARVVDCVFVAPGRLHLERRVTVCPAGTGPRDRPHQGGRGAAIRSISPRRLRLIP
jgi:hypothetical protein